MSSIPVYGVKLGATASPGPNQNCSTFTEATLPANHPVFNQSPTPISQKLGFPLVIHKLNTRALATTNPRVAWLMIGVESILAPLHWQDGVGDVVVVRVDKQPLSVKDLTAFTDYVWEILSTSDPVHMEVEEQYDPRRYYKPEMLKEYMKNYPKSRNSDVDFR